MKCEIVQRHLPLYLESDLDMAATLEVAQHLEVCIGCRERLDGEQRLELAIRTVLSRVGAPESEAWERVMARLPTRFPTRRRVITIAAAAVLVGVVIFFALPHREIDLSAAMTKNHQKYLAGALPPAIETRSAESLERYFGGKFAFPVILGRPSEGIAIVGGRSCYLGHSPCAHITAHVGNVAVSVFLVDETQLASFPEAEARMRNHGRFQCRSGPFHVLSYREDGRLICAIGELTAERLAEVTRQIVGQR